MRIVLQRVKEAAVLIDDVMVGTIGAGLCLLLGVEDADGEEDADWLLRKVSQCRIFEDKEGKMNRSLQELKGEMLIISQFTLHASTKKGNRPSFIKAAAPAKAQLLYNYFIREANKAFPGNVHSGEFGAHMQVHLINDGPVTLWLDSKNKE